MNTKAASSLLFQSRVNYLNGIPDKLKPICKLQFEASETGVRIYDTHWRKRFPTISIPYEQIISITFRKGMGVCGYDNRTISPFNEGLFLIRYEDAEGKRRFLDFQTLASTAFVDKNIRHTKLLKETFLSLPVLDGKIASE